MEHSGQLQETFEAAVASIKNTPPDRFKPDNNLKLKMYALYKQATQGDVSGKRPGLLDMVGRAKYDAWAKLKGTESSSAMEQYIQVFDDIQSQIKASE